MEKQVRQVKSLKVKSKRLLHIMVFRTFFFQVSTMMSRQPICNFSKLFIHILLNYVKIYCQNLITILNITSTYRCPVIGFSHLLNEPAKYVNA